MCVVVPLVGGNGSGGCDGGGELVVGDGRGYCVVVVGCRILIQILMGLQRSGR